MKRERLIRLLIRLYPRDFRERYGESLIAFHRERVQRATPLAWIPITADHVVSAARERLSTILRDVRYAARGIVRRPVFAAVVIGTIALGVGANAAIFSVVYGVLLRPLPYPGAERVVSFGHNAPYWLLSDPEFFDYRRELRSFTSLAAYTRGEANLLIGDEPERVVLASVSPEFFPTLGVLPAMGRVFAPDEDLVMPAPVVVLSHGLWQRRFGGNSGVVGQDILLNGIRRTIVGIMPPHFDYPTERTEIWLPMRRMNADGDRGNHYLFAVGRVRDDLNVERAKVEATAFAARMMRDNIARYDPNQPLVPAIATVADSLVGATRAYLWVLLGAVGFVLLIVCVNVANLLLARGEGRRKEMAVRTALGASRARLASQLSAECAVLTVAGGAAGLLLAVAGQRALVALAPASLPRVGEVALNWSVVGYAFAVSALAGLLFSLAPAVRATRDAPGDALKEGGRAARSGGSRSMRSALVIAEVALAVVMLTGAGLLVRSLVNLQSTDLGFETSSVLTANVALGGGYSEERTTLFYSQLLERVRAIGGVRAAGTSGWLPVVGAGGLWGVLAEGQSYANLPQGPMAVPQQVSPGYFGAIGIPIRRGREFTEEDRAGGPYSVVVSEALAEMLWPGVDALGKRMRLGGGETFMTVIGVAGDIRARGFDDTPEPTMYFPHSQTHQSAYFMPRAMSLIARTDGDPMRIAGEVRAIVRSLDATVPVSNVRTLDQVVGTSVANRTFSTALTAAFAVLALVLAGIGIFGVISYGVSERTFEIGVRMALGAEQFRVLALVTADGIRMAITGAVIGAIGAIAVARAIRSMLVDVTAFDAPTLFAVAAALALVVVVASLLPARRALRVNPTDALRGG
jgi:putative ABC transport system permease protein